MTDGREVRARSGPVTEAADPHLARRQLERLVEAAGEDPLATHPQVGPRLVAVLGASTALGDHLVAHPDEWRHLLPGAPQTPLDSAADVPELKLRYRRGLLQIAADDLTGVADVEQVMLRLSDLADATVTAAYRLAVADRPDPGLAVVAMGKCGGRELNYVSDVDVIFVASQEADLPAATAVAVRLMDICAQVAWPVDAALRPEGNRGALVRTLASHLAYYRTWARTCSGVVEGPPGRRRSGARAAVVEELQPLIWQAASRPNAVADIRDLRQRITAQVPRDQADREIKRGPGGLRDIEFAVQLLQLVHGRADESLRVAGTLPALRALIDGGYVGRADGEALVSAYRFLRTVEHRLQLQRLRRTHLVPKDPRALDWLAYALGYRGRRWPRSARTGWRWAPRSGGCTPSCCIGHCWRRSPGCRPSRCGSPRRRPRSGWNCWGSPTRRGRCGTCRH